MGHLERRDRDVALPDRRRDGFTRQPGLAARLLLPRSGRHNADPLGGQLDARAPAEPKLIRVAGDRVDAQTIADGVKVDVAGLDDRAPQIHRAVPAGLPVVKDPLAEMKDPAAMDARVRLDGVRL